jgi:hypothetical protein
MVVTWPMASVAATMRGCSSRVNVSVLPLRSLMAVRKILCGKLDAPFGYANSQRSRSRMAAGTPLRN